MYPFDPLVFSGFCYTVCYATVVTKTNRVARIFKGSATHPRCISPLSSTLIVLGLIVIELVILVIWLLVEPPRVRWEDKQNINTLFNQISFRNSDRAAYSDLNPDDGGQSLYPMSTIMSISTEN